MFVNRFRGHICSGLLSVVKVLIVAFLGPRVALLVHLLHFGGILFKLPKIPKQVFNLIFVIFGDFETVTLHQLLSNENVFSGILAGHYGT